MFGIALIITGVVFLGSGLYLVVNNTSTTKANTEESEALLYGLTQPDPVTKDPMLSDDTIFNESQREAEERIEVFTESKENQPDRDKHYQRIKADKTYEEMGLDFEKYVVRKFSRKRFIIKNWAGDKFVDGRYAETSLEPDLTLELKLGDNRYPFAVECKWRSEPKSNFIDFGKDDQLRRYQQFSNDKDIPTFIVLGVGGEPSNPEQVYVIPVDRFSKGNQHIHNLKQFQKVDDKWFFYDYLKKELR